MDFFNDLNGQEIGKATLALFAVIDILGMIPLILKTKRTQLLKPVKTTLTVGTIGLAFLFVGQKLLWAYDLDFPAFRAAGGIVLAVLGVELLFNIEVNKVDLQESTCSSVTPLGFPIIAGTGTLTTLVLLQEEYKIVNIIAAFLINLVVIYGVLRYVDYIERLLGRLMINFITKVMGLLLLSMGIQFIKYGFKA